MSPGLRAVCPINLDQLSCESASASHNTTHELSLHCCLRFATSKAHDKYNCSSRFNMMVYVEPELKTACDGMKRHQLLHTLNFHRLKCPRGHHKRASTCTTRHKERGKLLHRVLLRGMCNTHWHLRSRRGRRQSAPSPWILWLWGDTQGDASRFTNTLDVVTCCWQF
jgi:hypothetical protein